MEKPPPLEIFANLGDLLNYLAKIRGEGARAGCVSLPWIPHCSSRPNNQQAPYSVTVQVTIYCKFWIGRDGVYKDTGQLSSQQTRDVVPMLG